MEKYIVITLIILGMTLWVWAVADILRTQFDSIGVKMIMLLTVTAFPVMGPIVYFQLKANFKYRERRKFRPDFNKR